MRRKAEQLRQWERVMDNLIDRAKKSEDKKKSELLNQIGKIKAKKTNIENQLKRIKESGENDWQKEKDGLEKSWKELRNAFSNSKVGSQEK